MTMHARTIPLQLSIEELEWEHTIDASVAVIHHAGRRGAYEKGGLQIEPDEPESFELAAIWLMVGPMKVDISPLISDEQIEKLLNIVVPKIKRDMEDDLVEYQLKRFNRED